MSRKKSYLEISERKLLLRVIDIIVIAVSVWFTSLYSDFIYIDVQSPLVYQWLIVLSIYFLLFGEIFQIYNLDVSNNSFLMVRNVFVASLVTTLVYIFSPYITPSLPENRLQMVTFFFLIAISVIIWRFVYMWVLFSPKYFKSLIVVGHSTKVAGLLKLIKSKKFHNVAVYVSNASIENFKGFCDVTTTNLSNLIDANGSVTEVVISTDGFENETVKLLNRQLIQLFGEGINIKSFEKYYEEVTDRVPVEYLDFEFYKNINYSKSSENRLYLFTRRILDVLISIAGLFILLLFIPFIFIGNILGNTGPLFYVQDRVGKNGKIFKILKLRSMVKDAEKSGAVWAKKNDKRITAFGKFLRNTRFDEMPQFFNILRGDMSLIGPRPERPEFANELGKEIPFYAIRQVIKPGLTGWAQVSYPYAGTIEEQEMKLRYDLFYIKERSSFLDFKIFIKTITTVLFFRGQ